MNRFLLLLILFAGGWLVSPARAQTPTFQVLLVQLWPEYDRPSLLVIQQGQLSADTALPAEVTFRLPGYIDELHAVAVEQNGQLLEIRPEQTELRQEGDHTLLTFVTPAPLIQIEYYDAQALDFQGPVRQVAYQYEAALPSNQVVFELQVPFDTADLLVEPRPDTVRTADDGLEYQAFQVGALSPGDTVSIEASYERPTMELTVERLAEQALTAPPAAVTFDDETASTSRNYALGFMLIGLGAAILIGTGGYYLYRTRHQPEPEQARFCHRCGTALRPEADFCHACGAQRRQMQPHS